MTRSTLPIHRFTRQQAIGFRRDGRPIWPVAGGSQPTGEPPAGPPTDPPADPPVDPPEDEPLGDGGKAALAAERKARKAAEKLAAEHAAKLQAIEDRDKTEAQKLADAKAAAEQRAEAATRRAVTAEIRALAADFADPTDAADVLGKDPAKYLGDDGEIDEEAITADLAELLKRKPHWGKAPAGPRTPQPDPSQGPRGPVDIDAQIRDAESKGNVRESIRLKAIKLKSN
jgi:hypothetical protein